MSRDLRQLKGRNSYPDRCYYYSSTAVQNNKLVKDAQPLGRFDKRDTISFQWERPTINGMVSSVVQFTGTVETLDHVEDLKPDMYVIDNTGMLFIVVAPVVSDDANRGKVFGTRPQFKTTFKLMGLESE